MTDSPHDGWFGSVRRFLGTGAAVLRNRIELLAVELQEERLRLISALLLAATLLVFALLTLVMLTFTVLLAAGEEHRFIAAAVITAVYGVSTLAAYWRLRTKLKHWSAFSATRAELQKDVTWLQGKDSNS